jgi:hypothetical protein
LECYTHPPSFTFNFEDDDSPEIDHGCARAPVPPGRRKFFFEHHFAPTTSGIQGELHPEKLDTVLIGSSHTRQIYDMAALEKATGTKAFAIAYDGLDMQGMLPIVKSICAVHAACPKVLVIEAYRPNLARPAKLEDPRLYFDAPPDEAGSAARLFCGHITA